MTTDLPARATAIATNRDAGAAELVAELLPLLDEAIAAGSAMTLTVARIVCAGQPAMAPLWHACAAAVANETFPGRFARVRAELARAPSALRRAGGLALRHALEGVSSPLLLTLSFSSSVVAVLGEVAKAVPLRVVCGEGRPRLEGRRMARTLAATGMNVTLMTDAALTSELPGAAAVVVGADAFAAGLWVNKVGTHGLAAAAWHSGVPVYVVASRDKAVPTSLAARWQLPEANPAEIWASAPAQVVVVNRYFETTPAELATLFLTEVGPVSPSDLAALVARGDDSISQLLAQFLSC